LNALEVSRKKLMLDYIDLYLIHWLVKGRYVDTWKALEKLYHDGLARAIGLSNFQIHHMQDILAICDVRPAVNQVEIHCHCHMSICKLLWSYNYVMTT
jgi:diketogulonate reductase-like aldo/keto reductase